MGMSWCFLREEGRSRRGSAARVPHLGRLPGGSWRFLPGVLLAVTLLAILGCSQAGFSVTIGELVAKMEGKSKEFDSKVTDITIEVEAVRGGEGGEETAIGQSKIWRKGDKFRIEGSFKAPGMAQGLTSVIISDGEELWTVIPSVGKIKIPETGISSSQYADWSRMIPEDAELAGREKIGTSNAYKIIFSDTLMNYYLWVDSKRLIPLKVTMESLDAGFPSTTILYKDYREVEGMWGIPYVWETYMGEDLFTTTRVNSVKTNSGLTDDLFDASGVEEEEIDAQELMRRLSDR